MAIRFNTIFFSILLSNSLVIRAVVAADSTIVISDGQTLLSPDGTFELGFFSPHASNTRRYLGIWYKLTPGRTVVWVANRDNPVPDNSGILHLTTGGNLALRSAHNDHVLIWSTTTVGVGVITNPVVQLLDSGNLVVLTSNDVIAWQSFEHPTDTVLPGMKLGWDLRSNQNRRLTAWKTASDPTPGPYSLEVTLHPLPDFYILNGSTPVFRIGPWDGVSWGGAAPARSNNFIAHHYTADRDGAYYSFEMANKSAFCHEVLDERGVFRRFIWINHRRILYALVPSDQCDLYGHCGAYGVCDVADDSICKCLDGFEPKSQLPTAYSWNPTDRSEGCIRRTELGCRNGDGFRKVRSVKLPEMSNAASRGGLGLEDCRDACLNNCSCTAFAFLGGSGRCITWFGRLLDIRRLAQRSGHEMYVRLAASELPSGPGYRRRIPVTELVISSIVVCIVGILISLLWIRRCIKRGIIKVSSKRETLAFHSSIENKLGETEEGMKFSIIHYSSVLDATNNFSEENKLGEGGFGTVYKGQLLEGQEIAVKRLSVDSAQGLQEFENEILLIAKLQHRNLVRLLGYCIHREEKMLIYEYMPNKSLNSYIFDSRRRVQLNWDRRFHIIEGIAQGLLYLHKHSRWRIIHRDLKASNILLDDDMNPKISDFGIARIFCSTDAQERTRMVVGTYGYMAPEYAAGGLFSVKSDVFSFGVLVLEIISGERNNFTYQSGNGQTLIGHAWLLWNEAKWFELVDPLIKDGCDELDMKEICRCIHLGLMCVQDSFLDRPTMSEVIAMLMSRVDSASLLPHPKRPAFFSSTSPSAARENLSATSVSENCSLNEVTMTVTYGR